MDYKIEVVIEDVTHGDVQPILDYLAERGPDYDMARGNFVFTVWQRDDATRQWFYSDEPDDA